jgi:predicted Zn-dependent peptidase
MRRFLVTLPLSAGLLLGACATLPAPAEVTGAPSRLAKAQSPAPLSDLVRQVDIPFKTFTLDNGLRVVVHEDRKAPVVALSAWYNVGSKDEPVGQTGLAHLFEHIGLFNGTENVPGGLMEPLRQMGATDWNGTTHFDRTNYFQTVPTTALEQALYMESDRMGHLLGALTQERLDNQRGVVQNEKRQGDNQPYGLAFYSILEALFPEGHPYRHSVIGSMADLDAASMEQVRTWFRENYGPNNAVLVLAGDIDPATARTLVQKYFGHIPRGPVNEPAQASVPTLPALVSERMTDRVANTRLYRTWAVPGRFDEQAVPLDIAAMALGGLSSSRLGNALVRGDQTAVSVSSSYLGLQRVGIFFVTVDVKPGVDAAAVERRLDEIIRDFTATGPTEDEVRRVATSEVSGQIYGLEQVGGFTGKAVALAEGELYAKDPGFYRRELMNYAAAKPDQVRKAAQRWLSRPVHALRVDPGARPEYKETSASAKTAAPAASKLAVTPRPPMPPVGDVPNIDFPEIERATLSNGIPVIYARRATVPAVRIAMEFDAGNAADPAQALGTQSLMLGLLTEGTTSRTSVQIAEEQERLGASVSAAAAQDRTVLSLSALSPNLAPSLDLFADIVRNPAFAPAEVERLRARQLSRIGSELTSPAGMAQRALFPALYGNTHPYGRPLSGTGDAAAVKAVSRDDLISFHRRWIRPDAAQIFAVGDIPLADLVRQLESRLGSWQNPSEPRGTKNFAAAPAGGRSRIILIDRPQSPQSMILAGTVLPVTGTSEEVLAVTAANEVLGGDFLARINQDLRETRGWSYGVQTSVQMMENRLPLLIQAPVQTNQTGPSVQALVEHFRGFTTNKGVTPAELKRVISGNTRQLAGRFETSSAILSAMRSNALYRRPDNFWETVAGRYRAMSTQTLDQAARQSIDPGNLVFVVVGDAAVVRPQLEKVGLPVEVVTPR